MSDDSVIAEARKSIRHCIKFFESLQGHITKGKEPMLSRAMWATWCLHRYMNEKLITDVEEAMKENVSECIE